MDFSALVQAVGTLGFPIVCCGVMMWYVKYQTDSNRESIDKLNTQHTEEVKNMTSALNNNTLVLQKLVDKLDGKAE